jgi:predicted metal-dependent hydrolase
LKPEFAPPFIRGIEHFNALEFWEAHEAWEELWLHAETNVEQFLQGLIQIAAAYHHVKRGTFRGAVRLFDAGLARLSHFPERFCGLDRAEVERIARTHQAWAADRLANRDMDQRLAENDYPKLNLVDEPAMPHHNDW